MLVWYVRPYEWMASNCEAVQSLGDKWAQAMGAKQPLSSPYHNPSERLDLDQKCMLMMTSRVAGEASVHRNEEVIANVIPC